MCDQDGRSYVTNTFWANKLGVTTSHFEALSGGEAVVNPLAPAAVTGFVADEAGDSIGAAPGNPTVTIGQTIVATLQTIGDQDVFKSPWKPARLIRSGNMQPSLARAGFRWPMLISTFWMRPETCWPAPMVADPTLRPASMPC
jgi:hypothetical protein